MVPSTTTSSASASTRTATPYYDWSRINLANHCGNSASLTVAGWAYEDSGATGVDERHSLALLAMGVGGLASAAQAGQARGLILYRATVLLMT